MQGTWAKIRKAMPKGTGGGLSQIQVPVDTPEGEEQRYKTITDPTEVESTIIEANIKHFQQAKDTIFGGGVLKDLVPDTAAERADS